MDNDLDPFVYRMIDTFPRIHNAVYWKHVNEALKGLKNPIFLDIGCGPGLLLKSLDEKFNASKLVGIDISQDMLKKAKRILEKQIQQGKVELKIQHMQESPHLGEQYDAIFSSRVLRSFENLFEVLKNIRDALKPEGYLVVVDWDRQPLGVYDAWFRAQPDFGQMLPEQVISYHRNFARYSFDDWLCMLERASMSTVRVFRVDEVHIGFIAQK